LEREEAEVFGDTLYSDDSSICRAALLNGVINDMDGGEFNIVIAEAPEFFNNHNNNDVESKSKASKKNDRAFSIVPYVVDCPKPKEKKDKKSFFQIEL